MPVRVKVAQHDAASWKASGKELATSQSVLEKLSIPRQDEVGSILHTTSGAQTSLQDEGLKSMHLSVRDHGLVRAALTAYNAHHHLVLRPEDVWFAVLIQFSFLVNAHAEELQGSFVSHKGKKELIIRDPGQPEMSIMCRNMTELIQANVVDPELRRWIMPAFTTTTMHDEVVAAVIMMGTLQRYFDYVYDCTTCGIPTVTLLGERSDWVDIQKRIEKLSEYGEEPTQFLSLLRPVLRNMVATFDRPPGDKGVVDFWSCTIRHDTGSGVNEISGWMTTFCFWDEDGKLLYNYTASDAMAQYLKIDETVYHTVPYVGVPRGYVSVPVTYMDPDGKVMSSKLLAGFVGYKMTTEASLPLIPLNPKNTKQPDKGRDLGNLMSRISKAILRLRPGSSRSKNSIDRSSRSEVQRQEGPTSLAAPGPSTTSDTPAVSGTLLDTVRSVTGWWMYVVKGDSTEPMSRAAFYEKKIYADWFGQVSTAYVSGGKISSIESGLPRDWRSFR